MISHERTPRKIAHDLNNMLLGIQLNVDWLLAKRLAPESQQIEVLGELLESCKNSATLVAQLVDLLPEDQESTKSDSRPGTNPASG